MAPDDDVRTLHDNLEKSIGRYPHVRHGTVPFIRCSHVCCAGVAGKAYPKLHVLPSVHARGLRISNLAHCAHMAKQGDALDFLHHGTRALRHDAHLIL